MNENILIFDVETGPADRNTLLQMMPEFEAPSNYTKAESIKAYIEKKQIEYLSGEKAALSALTGEVLAIGYRVYNTETKNLGEIKIIHRSEDNNERAVIDTFWALKDIYKIDVFIGFNSNYFDIPFLVRRMWKLGGNMALLPELNHNKYLSGTCIDLVDLYNYGTNGKISLDILSKFLGFSGKNGDGALFYKMFAEDKEKAFNYLKNDIRLTYNCAAKFFGWPLDCNE